ncbi:MAG: MMPL family transporter [Gammaproteobacteria bacterium]|nr:MMPL family transporter [Gammaproteobacteria bacterium]
MRATLYSLYFGLVLRRPVVALLMVGLFILAAAWFARDFKLDASADSLLLENDADLRYYREIRERYGSDDFLFVTYTPHGDMFSDATLAAVGALRDELARVDRVAEVTSMLDVPLIESPPVTLREIQEGVQTLTSPQTDREMAARELRTSPLYKNLLMSEDGTTTALQVTFERDERYRALLEARDDLRMKRMEEGLTADEEVELERASEAFADYKARYQEREQATIAAVREVLERYRDGADIHLGGVPMIVSDMIDFVENDIRVFGIGVFCFIVALLAVAFKRVRWVLIPMVICAAAGIAMAGWLGLAEWRVTVVSSNFISLLLIITLSLTVHLVVRFEELHHEAPADDHDSKIAATMRSKLVPSFFTALTTMVAFGSLVFSAIRPVMDFGWMMVAGVAMAFVLSFLLFPALVAMLPPRDPVRRRVDVTGAVTRAFAGLIEHRRVGTLVLYGLVFAVSVAGITRLTVENSFIDYFKDTTEIHQGMLLIDRKLGGTTPLDVVLDPDEDFQEYQQEMAAEDVAYGGGGEAGLSGDSFWFNTFTLEDVTRVHEYLDSLDETGKVLSLHTTMAMLTKLNDDQRLDNLTLAVMHKRLPEDVKTTLFDPYMSDDGNQVRFGVRIIDSDPDLERDELLTRIRAGLEELGFEPGQINITGMVVLYNNVLQSLFQSQIMTLSVVFAAILLMLLALFRNLRLAVVGVMPTVVAAALILGLMGWTGIPLDIMTITIAAITVGIGVDDTIHYLHRMREEYAVDGDYRAAIRRSHASVGRAIYYTSITITLGFSILVLSNFIPTIYFGLLTGLAMIIALVANLTLLPLLVALVRPFKGDGQGRPVTA